MQTDISRLSTEDQAQLASLLEKLQSPDAESGMPKAKASKRGKRVPKKQIKFFTEVEIDKLFRVITSVRDTAMFRVAYHRGLRASEIGMLQMSDLDMKDERINFKRLKGSKGGTYHITSNEVRALRPWLKLRGTEPGPLFPSRQGTAISQQMLDVLMKRYGRLAGLPPEKCHTHTLKHACATALLNRGLPVEEIADHIGHRNIQNTLIYADYGDQRRVERDKRLRNW